MNFTIAFLPLDPYNNNSSSSRPPSTPSTSSPDAPRAPVARIRNIDPACAALEDLSPIGTIGRVVGFEQARIVTAGSGATVDAGAAILVEGKERFRVKNVLQKTPFMLAEVQVLEDISRFLFLFFWWGGWGFLCLWMVGLDWDVVVFRSLISMDCVGGREFTTLCLSSIRLQKSTFWLATNSKQVYTNIPVFI